MTAEDFSERVARPLRLREASPNDPAEPLLLEAIAALVERIESLEDKVHQ